MIGKEIKISFLQPARIFNFMYARNENNEKPFYIYSDREKVIGLPRDGRLNDSTDFQDTAIKMLAFKFFKYEEFKKNIKYVKFFNDNTDVPESVELGKILISFDLITNYIGKLTINNVKEEVLVTVEDAGEYTNKTDFDIILE